MDVPRSGHFLLRAPHGTVYRLPHKTDLHKTPACKSKECEDCSDISCPDFSSRQECPPKCRKGCKNQLSRSKPESVVRESEKKTCAEQIRRLREEESQEIVKLVQFLPHYGQLNPHPSLWQILFDNQDASQNDADDLIIRTEDEDDGHLLIQDLVEEQQPVQNVHQQNDSEEIFNRRDFDSNDDQVQKSMTSAYAKIRCSR